MFHHATRQPITCSTCGQPATSLAYHTEPAPLGFRTGGSARLLYAHCAAHSPAPSTAPAKAVGSWDGSTGNPLPPPPVDPQ